jgi:PleD family two-component response regulator
MPIRRHAPGGCVSSRRERIVRFLLTLNTKNLIKDTHPRALMSGAKFDVKGESIDEEHNQEESACQEEGGEEEVARAAR